MLFNLTPVLACLLATATAASVAPLGDISDGQIQATDDVPVGSVGHNSDGMYNFI
jgi:hypothetical protein